MTRRDLLPLASVVLPVIALVVSVAQLMRTAQRSSDQADEALHHWQQCIEESRQLRAEKTDLYGKLRAAQRGSIGEDVVTAYPDGYVCGQRPTYNFDGTSTPWPRGTMHWECRPGPHGVH